MQDYIQNFCHDEVIPSQIDRCIVKRHCNAVFQLIPNWHNVWLIISNNASLNDSLHVYISNSCDDILLWLGQKFEQAEGSFYETLIFTAISRQWKGRFSMSFTSFDLEWKNRLIMLKGNEKKYGQNIWLEISIKLFKIPPLQC